MRRLVVRGLGFFAPGFAGLSAWREGRPDPAAAAAPASVLPAALRRRASPLARLTAEVAQQAALQAGIEAGAVPLIAGSALGEIETAVAMFASFAEGEGLPSPTRFHGSVHNNPVAHLAIATANRGLSTAIAAGEATVAATLLEAWLLVEESGGDALVLLGDEPPPPPFAPERPYPAAAVALAVSAGDGAGSLATLAALRRTDDPAVRRPAPAPPPLADHPLAGAFALALAVAEERTGTLALGGGWLVELGEGPR